MLVSYIPNPVLKDCGFHKTKNLLATGSYEQSVNVGYLVYKSENQFEVLCLPLRLTCCEPPIR